MPGTVYFLIKETEMDPAILSALLTASVTLHRPEKAQEAAAPTPSVNPPVVRLRVTADNSGSGNLYECVEACNSQESDPNSKWRFKSDRGAAKTEGAWECSGGDRGTFVDEKDAIVAVALTADTDEPKAPIALDWSALCTGRWVPKDLRKYRLEEVGRWPSLSTELRAMSPTEKGMFVPCKSTVGLAGTAAPALKLFPMSKSTNTLDAHTEGCELLDAGLAMNALPSLQVVQTELDRRIGGLLKALTVREAALAFANDQLLKRLLKTEAELDQLRQMVARLAGHQREPPQKEK